MQLDSKGSTVSFDAAVVRALGRGLLEGAGNQSPCWVLMDPHVLMFAW